MCSWSSTSSATSSSPGCAKVRVHEFGIGFPPRALILGTDKETVYTLNWLPIGGFVRLEGEDGESSDPRAFVNAPVCARGC